MDAHLAEAQVGEPVPARGRSEQFVERVQELQARLDSAGDPATRELAEELVSAVVQMYGAGLERILGAVLAAGEEGERIAAGLTDDELVATLLLIHDLHPLDVGTRIRRALGRLGIGAELLSIDSDGVALIRLASGHGHASVQADVEQAVADAAPETTGVRIAPREPPLLQIGRRPAEAR